MVSLTQSYNVFCVPKASSSSLRKYRDVIRVIASSGGERLEFIAQCRSMEELQRPLESYKDDNPPSLTKYRDARWKRDMEEGLELHVLLCSGMTALYWTVL